MPKDAIRDITDVFSSGSRAAERPSHGGVGNSAGPHATDFASNQYPWVHGQLSFHNLDDCTYSGSNPVQILSMYKCVAEI